jgi:hypothetical protein
MMPDTARKELTFLNMTMPEPVPVSVAELSKPSVGGVYSASSAA